MKAKNRRHQASFNAQVGSETLTAERTVAKIAGEYQIHAVHVSQWKREIIDDSPSY
jgi:transposase-like protein